MSRMKFVIGTLLLGCAFANTGCTVETTGDGSASGAGGIAGMLATGGTSGMIATGGAGGAVATGGAGGMVASGGAGGMTATGGSGGMTATGGSGGMTATGGSGGMTATGGSGGMMAEPTTAVAMIMPFDTGTVTGTASFTQTGTDVTLTLALANCPDGMHGVHIHQGTSCADATTQGAHWDTTRGEGIPNVECVASTGSPPMFTRAATDPMLAWSIGGDAATDIVGHVIVVHGEGDPPPRIGCGVIE